MAGIEVINQKVREQSAFIPTLKTEIGKVIVGQEYLIDRLIIGLLANGQSCSKACPGLAKTLTVKTLASALDTSFQRIQFTPDLLPADLIGTLIYNPKDGDFIIKKGPVFANIILADEINRAPAKVQSALLEAMQERQVTIGDETFPLPEPFLVLATQNPIEQEGTYPLPEAQVDRFMLKLKVGYPDPRGGAPHPRPHGALRHRDSRSTPCCIPTTSSRRARSSTRSTWTTRSRTTSSTSSSPRANRRSTSSISRTTSATAPRRAPRST